MPGQIESFRDLIVWQKAMELAAIAYRLAKSMPRTEEYRLTSQLVRAAASVPANIAEGHSRGTRKDYANFISIARGSLAETETFLLLAVDVDLLPVETVQPAIEKGRESSRMLTSLLNKLREPASK